MFSGGHQLQKLLKVERLKGGSPLFGSNTSKLISFVDAQAMPGSLNYFPLDEMKVSVYCCLTSKSNRWQATLGGPTSWWGRQSGTKMNVTLVLTDGAKMFFCLLSIFLVWHGLEVSRSFLFRLVAQQVAICHQLDASKHCQPHCSHLVIPLYIFTEVNCA